MKPLDALDASVLEACITGATLNQIVMWPAGSAEADALYRLRERGLLGSGTFQHADGGMVDYFPPLPAARTALACFQALTKGIQP